MTGLQIQDRTDGTDTIFYLVIQIAVILLTDGKNTGNTDAFSHRQAAGKFQIIRAGVITNTADSCNYEFRRFHSCKALSVLYYGDYSCMDEAWLRLGRETKERGLVPAAPPRTIGIAASYTGRAINPGKYCSRIAMPVTES